MQGSKWKRHIYCVSMYAPPPLSLSLSPFLPPSPPLQSSFILSNPFAESTSGQFRAVITKLGSPVMAVYPLGFPAGPITATNVASSRAVNVLAGKAGHCWQDSCTPLHSSTGLRPRWRGESVPEKHKFIHSYMYTQRLNCIAESMQTIITNTVTQFPYPCTINARWIDFHQKIDAVTLINMSRPNHTLFGETTATTVYKCTTHLHVHVDLLHVLTYMYNTVSMCTSG